MYNVVYFWYSLYMSTILLAHYKSTMLCFKIAMYTLLYNGSLFQAYKIYIIELKLVDTIGLLYDIFVWEFYKDCLYTQLFWSAAKGGRGGGGVWWTTVLPRWRLQQLSYQFINSDVKIGPSAYCFRDSEFSLSFNPGYTSICLNNIIYLKTIAIIIY